MPIYLKLEGFLGPSKAKGHEHWFEFSSVDFEPSPDVIYVPDPGTFRRQDAVPKGLMRKNLIGKGDIGDSFGALWHAQLFAVHMRGQLDFVGPDGKTVSYKLEDVVIGGVRDSETALGRTMTLVTLISAFDPKYAIHPGARAIANASPRVR